MPVRFALFSFAMILFAGLVHVNVAHAQQAPAAPTSLEDGLYNYILDTQISGSSDSRANGEWEIYSILNGGSQLGVETDSFLTAQQLVALSEVNRHHKLPYFAQLQHRAVANLQTYVQDSATLGDPDGMIAYFPITEPAAGTRGVRIPITKIVKTFNVPTDLDSSSALAMYYEMNGGGGSYLSAYATSVGRFRDEGRSVEHPHDRQWKPVNSGAFMTWGEADQVVNPKSRIFEGINDVDCVVDLNVLAGTSLYRRTHGALPAATAQGVADTCQLMNEAVEQGRFRSCALWYDRASQFWYSYSRAVTDGAKCLASSVPTARANIVAEARELTSGNPVAERNRTTRTSEILISLKRLYPVGHRDADVQQLIVNLDAQIRALTVVKGDTAYPMTEDSLYLAHGYGMRLDWYSRPYSASIELLALTLP